MFVATKPSTSSKASQYDDLNRQLASLLSGERDFVANAANTSAFLYQLVPDLNWAGFYLLRGSELVLGPFQGQPACVRIPVHPNPKGVCGNAAFHAKTYLVPDVHAFPGHIACDSASNAEIVLPITNDPLLIGVLDLDSPTLGRFDSEDQVGLERLVATFTACTDLPRP